MKDSPLNIVARTVLVLISATALVFSSGVLAEEDTGTPKISVPNPTHDFGSVSRGVKVTHIFKILNEGDAPLSLIKTKGSCGCTTAIMSRAPIPPGGEGEVSVTFDTGGRRGKNNKTVNLTTNDPKQPTTVLRVKADIEFVFDFENRTVYFGRFHSGTSMTKTAYLLVKNPDGVQFKAISSSSPQIVAKQVGDTQVKDGFTRYPFQVTLSGYMPEGRLTEKVVVRSNRSEHPDAELTISGIIVGEVEIRPEWLTFLLSEPQSSETERTKEFFVNNYNKDRPLEIVGVEDPQGHLQLEVTPLIEGIKYQVTATFGDVEIPQGESFRGEVIVRTNSPDKKELVVKYTAARKSEYNRKENIPSHIPRKGGKAGKPSVVKISGDEPSGGGSGLTHSGTLPADGKKRPPKRIRKEKAAAPPAEAEKSEEPATEEEETE